MLRLENVHAYYGESHILQGVDLEVGPGEIVCLLGRNGVGKTTTLRAIMGLTPPREGRVVYQGRVVNGLSPHRIARMGIGFVDENRRIFPRLTVQENLEVAIRPLPGKERRWPLERIYATFPMLAEIRRRDGDYLSGGQQQMLAIARALVGEPQLLLLDEPNEGLAPVIVQQIGDLIHDLAQTTTILFTEQNLGFAMKHAQRGYVLEKGRVVHASSREDFQSDSSKIEEYLTV
jgi:branched-chain amino acid transport system ATP-binding protein